MKVSELITLLQALPKNAIVQVNDNMGGEIYDIECVDHFDADEYDPESVVLQVNI